MKNCIIDIEVKNIKYDPEFKEPRKRYPKGLTVSLSEDMIDCVLEDADDADELTELIADEIESKTGIPAASFSATLSVPGYYPNRFDVEF